jgi:hypothetical protein
MQTQGQVQELLEQPDKLQITTGLISDAATSRIRQIVESEKSHFEIAKPLDRLESFFMKIVEKAQRENQPTSGAVSRAEVGGFLAGDNIAAGILDKLVAAPVVDAPRPETVPVAQVKPAADGKVLDQLTAMPAPAKTEPVAPRPAPKPEPQKIKRSVLDELTGKNNSSSGDAANG